MKYCSKCGKLLDKRNITMLCKNCRVPWNKGKIGCYSDEILRSMREGQEKRYLTMPGANKGKVFSLEQRQKMSIAAKKHKSNHKGKHHSQETINLIRSTHKGKHHSPETEFKKGIHKGKNSPAWKGGITSINKWIRSLVLHIEWIKSVFRRDNYKCQECGEVNKIEAHHIKAFSVIMKEFLEINANLSPIDDTEVLVRLSEKHAPFWDINNGITLCHDCHSKKRSKCV